MFDISNDVFIYRAYHVMSLDIKSIRLPEIASELRVLPNQSDVFLVEPDKLDIINA